MTNLYMIFDVESIGLHGQGFAVGYTVIDRDGVRQEEGMFACPSDAASGTPSGHEWVKKNVPNFHVNCESTLQVRHAFWAVWQFWKSKGALLVADCCWPVEARFLNACVCDDLTKREWEGPYPLHDLASILFARGNDPLLHRDRLEDELPEHNPLADARQSARLLIEALNDLEWVLNAATPR